jgi:hypothetical protein
MIGLDDGVGHIGSREDLPELAEQLGRSRQLESPPPFHLGRPRPRFDHEGEQPDELRIDRGERLTGLAGMLHGPIDATKAQNGADP